MNGRITVIRLVTALILACTGHSAAAQTYYMTVTQPLKFGSFGLAKNDAVYSIQVLYDGTVIADPEFIFATQPQHGEISFTDLPPNITFFVGINAPNTPAEGGMTLDNPTNVTDGGGGPFFTLSNFNATDLTTDNNGDGTISFGATLSTNGLGGVYDSGTYTGTFELTIYY